ncbi:MAG: type II toxin-antitoxin system PemK/MazF family toxin [Proteobacteria bacterium]|nr:type II toxin-antitoxin system PemK/MazF family toxin [Pseudomonadota bacterium]
MVKYDVYWVDLKPTKGAMMKKVRPAVIVSPSEQNQYLQTVVICPLTSRIHEHWPTRVQVKIGKKNGEIAIDQIRTIPKESLTTKIRNLNARERKMLDQAISQYFEQS